MELTAALLLAKLQSNIFVSLENYPVKSSHYWVDSTSVLYWLPTKGSWTIYAGKSVKRIEMLSNGHWKYVLTQENPSDLGIRGVNKESLAKFWYEGPRLANTTDSCWNQRYASGNIENYREGNGNHSNHR